MSSHYDYTPAFCPDRAQPSLPAAASAARPRPQPLVHSKSMPTIGRRPDVIAFEAARPSPSPRSDHSTHSTRPSRSNAEQWEASPLILALSSPDFARRLRFDPPDLKAELLAGITDYDLSGVTAIVREETAEQLEVPQAEQLCAALFEQRPRDLTRRRALWQITSAVVAWLTPGHASAVAQALAAVQQCESYPLGAMFAAVSLSMALGEPLGRHLPACPDFEYTVVPAAEYALLSRQPATGLTLVNLSKFVRLCEIWGASESAAARGCKN